MIKIDFKQIIRDIVWFGWWYDGHTAFPGWYRYKYKRWTIRGWKAAWIENYERYPD